MLKKIFISILTAFFLLATISVPLVKAEWYDQTYGEWEQKVYDATNPQDIFGERYTNAQVFWIIYSLQAFVTKGFIPKDISSALTTNDASALLTAIKSLFGTLDKLTSSNQQISPLAALFGLSPDKPISGISYVGSNLEKFHLIPTAYAQEAGFGYQNISVVMDMWKVVRNFSYALATIAVIIMAFMIMFRVKINPQTVVSVQSSIPKVAIALIFITFSYAIAGFMVDLMYVVIGLLSGLFSTLTSGTSSITTWYYLMTKGLLGFGIIGNYAVYAILFFLGLTISLATMNYSTLIVAPAISLIIFIITLIVAIFFLWYTIKVFFLLIKTLASIYLAVIFAPLQIGIGLIYQGTGFGAWLKGLAANLAVFPVVSGLFGLAFVFAFKGLTFGLLDFFKDIKQINDIVSGLGVGGVFSMLLQNAIKNVTSTTGSGSWPLFNSQGLGGLVTTNFDAVIFMGVSFVIITLIPKASDIIKSMIEGKPFGYGLDINKGLVVGAGAQGAGLVGQRLIKEGEKEGTPQWVTSLGGKLKKSGEVAGEIARYLK